MTTFVFFLIIEIKFNYFLVKIVHTDCYFNLLLVRPVCQLRVKYDFCLIMQLT